MYIALKSTSNKREMGLIRNGEIDKPVVCPHCQGLVVLDILKNRIYGAMCTQCGKAFSTIYVAETPAGLFVKPTVIECPSEVLECLKRVR